ncbi:hypothetical protein SLA2020_346250 [Shorea laevis]
MSRREADNTDLRHSILARMSRKICGQRRSGRAMSEQNGSTSGWQSQLGLINPSCVRTSDLPVWTPPHNLHILLFKALVFSISQSQEI